jgi:hypothetical protein
MKKKRARREPAKLAVRIREAVDRGADTAERVHKRVARLPLAPFEGVEPFEDVVRDLHRVSDRSIGAIYDLVRDVNHEVVRLAEDWLAAPRVRAKPRARHKLARRPAASAAA